MLKLFHASSKQVATIGVTTVAGAGAYLYFKARPIAQAAPNLTLRFMELTAKPALSMFFVENKPKFNLQEKTPQTKDAQQVYRENPGKILIGVFNPKTNEITLMPAMNGYISVKYNEDDCDKKREIVSATKNGQDLTTEQLQTLNKDFKHFIPRFRDDNLVSHQIVLSKMGILHNKNDYYGFSVTPGEEGHPAVFCWKSCSLNSKANKWSEAMPQEAQKEVEKIIASWSKPQNEHEGTSTQSCL